MARLGDEVTSLPSCGVGRRKRLPHVPWRRGHLAYLAYDLTDVVLDSLHEGGELRGAPLDAVQVCLPLAGHDGALDLGVDYVDQADSFVGGFQALAVAHNIFALEQHFDDGSAGGGRAQAGFLHGVGELLLVERLAGGFHGGEEGAFGETLGRPRLLFQNLDVEHVLRLTFGEPRRQFLLVRRIAGSGRGFLRLALPEV